MRPFGTGSRITIAWTLLCLGLLAGCRSSGIDPSGEHVFTQPPWSGIQGSSSPYHEYPGGQLPWDNVRLIVNPSQCAAPVGSDVIIMAGVLGPDNYLRTNERVEWSLSPDSQGEFVDFDHGTWTDLALGDFTWPRKKDSRWVVTSTSRRYLRLNRETPTTTDDVCVARGQTWVAVSSPVEGLSHVTAYAPSVYGWDVKKQTATILWVDALCQFPSPVITAAGGRAMLTTTVSKQTDRSPRAGWRVRYEIAGGPPAGFAPDGAAVATVVTNEAGQASVEIAQAQPAAGVNAINIQVIRPSAIDGGEPLVVRSGGTTASWSAPQLTVRKTGPAVGSIGATLSYRIAVVNSGDLPADDVAVVDEIPEGTELVTTRPPATVSGSQLRWTLGRLEPRQSASMDVDLRALRSGTLNSCAEAVASGGIRAKDCVSTVVGTADLAVRIQGPTSAAVGDQISYEIIVENHGEAAATGLLIKDRFDEGLEYPGARSPLEKELDNLPPGQSMGIGITFRATRAGNLCHTVEVTGDGGARASAQACVNVTEAARPAAPATGQGGRAAVTVEKVGPATAEVGQPALFTILVRNTGDVTLTNVRIVDAPDTALVGGRATEGGQMGDDGSVTWTYPSLPIGAVTRLQIECRCDRAVAEAVNRVSVTSDQGAQDKAEARVAVQTARPSPLLPPSDGSTAPGLSLSVINLTDSVGVGRTVTYEIIVKNVSPSPDEDVTLEVEVPPGMSTLDAQIVGLGGVRHKVYGQTIVFDPVETIRAGDQIRYTVRTQANTPGKMTLRARARSRRLATGLTGEKETEIHTGS